MNYHAIKKCNMTNGDGLRVVLFVSGCCHHCKGCHNPETHDPNSGIPFDENAKNELYDELNKDWCTGITLSGGDPLFVSNRKEILNLVKDIKLKFPKKNIWLYTGYTYDEIKNIPDALEIIKYCDVLIDGRFVESLKDYSLKWRGSSNQNIIYLNKSYKPF